MYQTTTTTDQRLLTPQQLAAQVRRLTATPAEWVARVRLDPEGRWYEQIHMSDACELWLISWLPGQSTGFHDHGGANGAFGVVWGQLDESRVARGSAVTTVPAGLPTTTRPVTAGTVRSFGPRCVHDVRNSSGRLGRGQRARLLPPLSAMTRYDLTPGGLVPVATEGTEDW